MLRQVPCPASVINNRYSQHLVLILNICLCVRAADRYVAAQAPLTGPRLDAYITAHQAPLAELEYENICRQVQPHSTPGVTAVAMQQFHQDGADIVLYILSMIHLFRQTVVTMVLIL